MLKRKRPTTPSSAVVEIPDYAESLGDRELDSHLHDVMKRRRTVVPVLDGMHRGNWPNAARGLEEEELLEEGYDANRQETPALDEFTSEYKDTNELLRQLHLEHQVRTQQLSQPIQVPQASSQQHSLYTTSTSCKTVHSTTQHPVSTQNQFSLAEESSYVWSRYEDNNKLLGSLVRSRLRNQA